MLRNNLIKIFLTTILVVMFHTLAVAEVKFKDNIVKFQPNFGAGSSTEALARILAPYFAKNLPGNPQVIVEPIMGGGGTKLAKKLLETPGDGHSAGLIAILNITKALGRPMPLELNKLKNVGTFVFPTMIMARKELNFKSLQDLIDYKKELIIAASKPNAPGVAPLRTWMIANNIKHRIVTGYAGQPACVAALQAGEIDLTPLSSSLYMAMKKTYAENGAVAILENGLANPAGGEDLAIEGVGVMTLDAAWKKYTPDTVGSDAYKTFRFISDIFPLVMQVTMSPDTPKEYLEAWRTAFTKGFEDPGFKKYLKDTQAPDPMVLNGEQTDATVVLLEKGMKDPAIMATVERLKKKSL